MTAPLIRLLLAIRSLFKTRARLEAEMACCVASVGIRGDALIARKVAAARGLDASGWPFSVNRQGPRLQPSARAISAATASTIAVSMVTVSFSERPFTSQSSPDRALEPSEAAVVP